MNMDGSEYRERRNVACCKQHEYPKRDEGREMSIVSRKSSQRSIGGVEREIISVGRCHHYETEDEDFSLLFQESRNDL